MAELSDLNIKIKKLYLDREFFSVAVIGGKRGKNGVEYLVYVVHKVKTSLSHIRESYRQRFGIESSYRLKNSCRIRTTTKKPVWRLLLVGISFLLVNIWVNFRVKENQPTSTWGKVNLR